MPPTIGYHCSHEQLPPSELLRCVRRAEDVGFTAAMCSDHLSPWSARQGHSGQSWAWLGAASQVVDLPLGAVCAPGQRYHPAVVAQALATLAEMAPGRVWFALGSGEALNEHVTGDPWPDKPTRDARLLECVEVIRALLAGEEVTHRGLVVVDRARIWTLPPTPPPLLGTAVTPATARTVGGWADGLLTVNQPVEDLRRALEAFREGGGEGKPAYCQVHVSWARDRDEALSVAHDQWRYGVFGGEVSWELETAAQFDAASAFVRPEDTEDVVLVSDDLGEVRARLCDILDLGFDGLYVHQVPKEQDPFLDAFGAEVLPELLRA